ncbi:uncharacterized protein PHALS_08389 [Plasmopara halstedii]|uniref:RxLR-like protein n=1 Tax=Plasmopara halstedii TaxID=4781 RepID=A0A0P1ABT2_PLAHL|nr:uncharacterized protein PHALS_08389 [Plasmopara halstedii]CEG38308.1 hypothetical protein PHALS_08389 [Plasmopara halstedii]|eukprot:XP_024574677.1 hypothetical protein PHALS_08389 [Plasmopara halstedii]
MQIWYVVAVAAQAACVSSLDTSDKSDQKATFSKLASMNADNAGIVIPYSDGSSTTFSNSLTDDGDNVVQEYLASNVDAKQNVVPSYQNTEQDEILDDAKNVADHKTKAQREEAKEARHEAQQKRRAERDAQEKEWWKMKALQRSEL